MNSPWAGFVFVLVFAIGAAAIAASIFGEGASAAWVAGGIVLLGLGWLLKNVKDDEKKDR